MYIKLKFKQLITVVICIVSSNLISTQSLYEFFGLNQNIQYLPEELKQMIAREYMKKHMPGGWWYNAVTFNHDSYVNSAVFNSNDDRILTTSADKLVKLWDIKRNLLATFKHDDPVVLAVFNSNNDRILTASWNGTSKLWFLNGKLIATLSHNDWVNSAEFDSNEDRVLASTRDGTAKLWNLNDNVLVTFSHDRGIGSVIFNLSDLRSAIFRSNDNRVLTASYNKAKLWDFNCNLFKAYMHEDLINSVMFNSNGDKVLTASDDETAKIWALHKFPTLEQVLLRFIIGKYLIIKKPKKIFEMSTSLLSDIANSFEISLDDLQNAWDSLDLKIQNDLWRKIQIFVNKYKI